MRHLIGMPLTIVAIAAAWPAHAQFAAEQPASEYGADTEDAPVTGADYGYGQSVGANDPYAADPASNAMPSQPIGDRTVGDLASGVLGAKAAQHLHDAETIVREVIGKKSAASDDTPVSPNGSAQALVRDFLGVVRTKKSPQ